MFPECLEYARNIALVDRASSVFARNDVFTFPLPLLAESPRKNTLLRINAAYRRIFHAEQLMVIWFSFMSPEIDHFL